MLWRYAEAMLREDSGRIRCSCTYQRSTSVLYRACRPRQRFKNCCRVFKTANFVRLGSSRWADRFSSASHTMRTTLQVTQAFEGRLNQELKHGVHWRRFVPSQWSERDLVPQRCPSRIPSAIGNVRGLANRMICVPLIMLSGLQEQCNTEFITYQEQFEKQETACGS